MTHEKERPAASGDWLDRYIAELRERAKERESEGAPQAAALYRFVATELGQRRTAAMLAELTVAEAAERSGYSRDQIRRLVREGTITLAAGDLPRKPGHGVRREDGEGSEGAPGTGRDLGDRILLARQLRGCRRG